MFKSLRKVIKSLSRPEVDVPNIHQMVARSVLNRRKDLRIKYPVFGGLGPLPNCEIQNVHFTVLNISQGGVCVQDIPGTEAWPVGAVFYLALSWSDRRIDVKSKLVAKSAGRLHIQFLDIDINSRTRIGRALASAASGQRLSQIHANPNGQVTFQASELWSSKAGESLVIKEDPRIMAELVFNEYHLVFRHNQISLLISKDGARFAAPDAYVDALICLSNINQPSAAVKSLCETLGQRLMEFRTHQTGTGI